MSISIAQVARMTGQNRVKVGRWKRERPQLYTIIEFGCKKLIKALPADWSYSYAIDQPFPHCFVHENYAPDYEDADSENIIEASTFIEGLNEIKERTK